MRMRSHIGDHLEQLFTLGISPQARQGITESLIRILRSGLPVTLLFCIREDYLPQLYELSSQIPELYNRENTFRLHKLDEASARAAIERASSFAKAALPASLVKRIPNDLREAGGGTIYPPFLQIVGYSLYSEMQNTGSKSFGRGAPDAIYERLGGVENIVNNYLDRLLDGYS